MSRCRAFAEFLTCGGRIPPERSGGTATPAPDTVPISLRGACAVRYGKGRGEPGRGDPMASSRLEDLRRLCDPLGALEKKSEGARRLCECSGRMSWTRRGVCFFREPGEVRTGSGTGSRASSVRTGSCHPWKPRARTCGCFHPISDQGTDRGRAPPGPWRDPHGAMPGIRHGHGLRGQGRPVVSHDTVHARRRRAGDRPGLTGRSEQAPGQAPGRPFLRPGGRDALAD